MAQKQYFPVEEALVCVGILVSEVFTGDISPSIKFELKHISVIHTHTLRGMSSSSHDYEPHTHIRLLLGGTLHSCGERVKVTVYLLFICQ